MHEEDSVSNGIIVGKKGKTVGKLVDDQYNPLSVVTVALFTDVSFDKDGKAIWSFNRQNFVAYGCAPFMGVRRNPNTYPPTGYAGICKKVVMLRQCKSTSC